VLACELVEEIAVDELGIEQVDLMRLALVVDAVQPRELYIHFSLFVVELGKAENNKKERM
jgi:hypothetical protein